MLNDINVDVDNTATKSFFINSIDASEAAKHATPTSTFIVLFI